MIRVVTVSIAYPSGTRYRDEEIVTGIFKLPVAGPVNVGLLNLEGDGQADLRFHGGPDKAIYAYPLDHYAFWENELHRTLEYGTFGENLTISGIDENRVRIGDIWRIGSALVQVSEPRIPCFKLVMKLSAGGDFSTRFLRSGRTGFYLRVLREGVLEAGNRIDTIFSSPASTSVAEFLRATQFMPREKTLLRSALAAPALSQAWRGRVRMYLDDTLRRALPSAEAFRSYLVADRKMECDGIVSLMLRTEDDNPPPEFLPGQFVNLILTDPTGEVIRRPYSISCRPGIGQLRITVKHQIDSSGRSGSVSGLIHEQLAVGNKLTISAPAGAFHIDPESKEPLVLIAAGVGITPLMAMLEQAAPLGRAIVVGHGVRDESCHPFAGRLVEIGAIYPHVQLNFAYSRQTPVTSKGRARIIAGRLRLADLGEIPHNASLFICGPPVFVDAIRQSAVEIGVPEWRIRTESFGAASRLTGAPAGLPASGTVQFAELDAPVQFESPAMTLLEFAEQSGLSPPSGCRAGSCGLCTTRLVSGSIRYVEPVDPPGDSLVPLCCVVPVGAIVLGPLGRGSDNDAETKVE